MKKIICVNTSSFGDYDKKPIALLERTGMEIRFNPFGKKLTKPQLIDFCINACAVVAGTEDYDAEVIGHLSQLRIISRCGVGVDNIDHAVVQKKGIKVFNTPDAPTDAVAELTIALILNLLRKVTEMDHAMRNGHWQKLMGNLLKAKKVGIIGYGRIGRKVAGYLEHFECEIAYADPCPADSSCKWACMPLQALLAWADVISLHVSSGDLILGPAELSLMKKGAFLVNVSRGGVVDEGMLYQLLSKGALAGAALDVFGQEPYAGSLLTLPNVILTPHIGSYAKEGRTKMEMEAASNLITGLGEMHT